MKKLFSPSRSSFFRPIRQFSSLCSISLCVTAALSTTNVQAAAFGLGDLVVVRGGDGSAALNSNATATFLDEYTPGGVFVQSIPLPTSLSGLNQPFTLSGSATSEGFLALSQ